MLNIQHYNDGGKSIKWSLTLWRFNVGGYWLTKEKRICFYGGLTHV